MACKTDITTINGKQYCCTQMAATRAIKNQLKLIRLVGEPIAEIFKQVDKNGFDESIAISAMAKLGINLDSDEFFKMFVELISECAINNVRVNFEQDYSGNILEAWQAFIFVLKVNYYDFFLEIMNIAESKGILQKQSQEIEIIEK